MTDPDKFIPLNRTFHELSIDEEAGDDADFRGLFGLRPPIHWDDLLSEHRVVLLSEAGSGKTEEIRHVTRDLRADGKPAFFLRVEHIVQDFESCFEEGSLENFNEWVQSGEEGWLLLDSVDEARLRDPKDFERAIRMLSMKLKKNVQRAHIVITGRTNAWRPKTDLLLCQTAFPYAGVATSADEDSLLSESSALETVVESAGPDPVSPFKIVALDDLHGAQIEHFAAARGVTDFKAFRLAIERAEAESFTSRPLDLAELIEFWKANSRIGSRLELMRNSIDRRLEERDQDRSEARPITEDKARKGARLVAAAATLTQQSAIRVPDGSRNAKGISIKEVLTDWDDIECATLLSRPIFDEGIYGTVRFYHRSVREYLTAEWLHALIIDDASRARIEDLFFRTQYGIEVIVPTMRPVLPWLAILDERILTRVVKLAPEILFEGGDPSQLPLEVRKQILRQTCEQLAQPAHGRSATDYAAVQRFTNPDLAGEIRALLELYSADDDIVWFLVRMIWQGDLKMLATDAKHVAVTSRARYTRIAAFRAIGQVGSPDDQEEVRRAFLAEDGPVRREWLAELLPSLPHTSDGVAWLIEALERTQTKERFASDSLSNELSRLVTDLPLSVLPQLMVGLHRLLKKPPVIERRHCEISKQHSSLALIAAQAAARLIEGRDPTALEASTLAAVRMLPLAEEYGSESFREFRSDLPALIRAWPEFNRALFWHSVAEERAQRETGDRLIDYWTVSVFGSYWAFDASDFETICGYVADRELLDDRLVGLTLAFAIYRENNRPAAWRKRLKEVTAGNDELTSTLNGLLNPAAKGRAKWKRQEAKWKKRQAVEAAKEQKQLEESKRILSQQINLIRNPGKIDFISDAQAYLHERMRDVGDSSGKWTEGNWRALIPAFGEPIARAFRDGAVSFWRGHRPKLRSEGAVANSVPFSAIFGLTGLSIEARETTNWPTGLSSPEAELATRYALYELNGFPSWLPKLYDAFPTQVAGVLLDEIAHELATEKREIDSHYALYDVSWHGRWLWDRIAPALIVHVRGARRNLRNLGHLLAIVQGSSISDSTIAKIASQKAKATRNLTFAPLWFAVWAGVEPAAAIPALAARLAETKDVADQIKLAIRFIVALIGGRSEDGRAREAYRTVEHVETLYILMHKYIRRRDDIERAGTGVYSPGPRDDAQDAREALFAYIKETPGKAAYLALLEMARAHPDEGSRPWMNYHAKNKAASDADIVAWTPRQVRDFNDELVRTPANHRDLWYFAIDKLNALKHDLEQGDASVASILQAVDQETEIRKFIGGWCRDRAGGRYNIPQEEELADAKRPDLRFLGVGFDGPVPVELKLADKWTGPHLFERLETQLCGDYLRDVRSSRGIFGLVYFGAKTQWELPAGGRAESFDELVDALSSHWAAIASQYPNVEDIAVIGIDLTKRGIDAEAVKAKKRTKKATKEPNERTRKKSKKLSPQSPP